MKRILNWIMNLFRSLPTTKQMVWDTTNGSIVSYTILYTNLLSSNQIYTIIHKCIDKFPPNCKPLNCTVNSSGVRFNFISNCISGESLKRVMDVTLEGTSPKAEIRSILCDGVQIYPLQYKTK
jgi:hypothetical protein